MGDLRIGSLCTGYGGLDKAVQAVLGGTLEWVADPDPGARAILDHHHPTTPNLGDITALNWLDVPPVDVLTAGYPCQPFSSAGRQKGTADERHIWPYIATGIRVLRPRFLVLENVANHLRLGFDTVLGDLARLGFDAEWCLVRASEIGAPHRRERLFVLAWSATDTASDGRDQGRPEPARQQGRPDVALGGGAAAYAQGQRHRDGGAPGLGGMAAAALAGALADADRDPLRQQPEPESGRGGQAVAGLAGQAATDTDRGGLTGHPERNRQPHGGKAHDEHRLDADRRVLDGWGQYAPAIARWGRVLGRPAPDPTEPAPRGGRRLSPAFVEWLMGLDAGHVTAVPGLKRNAQLKALGNGVVWQQGAAALNLLLDRMAVAA